jgi:acyl-CoA thioesterase I
MVKIVSISVVLMALLIGGYVVVFRDANQSVINDIEKQEPVSDAITIVAFGDSLTAGYGLPLTESYPAQLEQVLTARGLRVKVINAGVSGETTKGNLERAAFIRSQNPDIVLLGIGGNDALRALPVSETKANMLATIETLKSGENPPIVMLLQMQSPLNAGLRYKQEFDALYTDLAESESLVLLPFITTTIFLDQGNKLPDGIHLNKTGYAKVIELYLEEPVAEVVEKLGG